MKVYIHVKKNRVLLGIFLCIAGLLGIIFACSMRLSSKSVDAAGGSAYEFASDSKLNILEIVPYHAMAQVGYLIKGEEPIDITSPLLGPSGPLHGEMNSLMNRILRYDATENKYVNLETFKTEVLRLDTQEKRDAFKIDVITVTPEELNAHPELISKAKIYFIYPKAVHNAYIRIYEEVNSSLPGPKFYGMQERERPNFYFRYDESMNKVSNDISWNCAKKIFYEISQNSKAIYIDCNVYTTDHDLYWVQNIPNPWSGRGSAEGTSNNMAKLFLMLQVCEVGDFYNAFLKDDTDGELNHIDSTPKRITDAKTGFSIKTGYFNASNGNGETAVYWNSNTFLPDPGNRGNLEEYYASLGFNNPWVSPENRIVLVHKTIEFAKAQFSLNGSLHDYMNPNQTEVQDFIELRDGTRPARVTGFDALATILGLINFDPNISTNTLTILDLEPCKAQTLTKATVSNWVGNQIEEDDITIIPMTMSEFIGRRDDIAEQYDMIYLGSGTDEMNKDSGATVYNDDKLNGLIYLHMGDKAKGSGDNTLFYSGNDISKLKLDELKRYVVNKCPVIVSDKFYSTNGTILKANSNTLDKASNVYEFVKWGLADENKSFVVRDTDLRPIMMESLLVKPRVKIEKGSRWPVEYDESNANKFLSKEGNEYQVTYDFKLKKLHDFPDPEEGPRTYDVKIYFDYNCDGVYADDEQPSVLQVQISGSNQSKSGGEYHVPAESNITVSTKINPDYVGVLPYRIEVKSNETDEFRTSIEGYVAIKGDAADTIRVLQIVKSSHDRNNASDVTENMDLAKLDSLGGSVLSSCLSSTSIQDLYKFTFVTVTADEFNHLYTTDVSDYNNYWVGTSHSDILTQIDYIPILQDGSSTSFCAYDGSPATSRLSRFDIVVVGEGASSGIEALPYSDIVAFLNSKKPVIMTGDVSTDTQFILQLRNLAGMDRFGFDSTDKTGKDKPYKHRTPQSNVPTDQYQSKNNLQAYTYAYLAKINSETYGYLSSVPPRSSEYKSDKATTTNQGFISQYPFKIGNDLVIGDGKGQPYQLDYEEDKNNDKKPDVNVWYSLSNSSNGAYSCSPNDVRNNYYLYNDKTFFYDGVNKLEKEKETKLFINTLVAAYMTSRYTLEFVVTNGQKLKTNEYYVFVDSDESQEYYAGSADIDRYKQKVIFTITGNPPGGGIRTIIRPESGGTPYSIFKDGTTPAVQITNYWCAVGTTYYIYVPKSELNSIDKFILNVQYGSKDGKVSLVRRNLFELQ